MVDFSRPEEVQRLLETFEPIERQRSLAKALAARSALRRFPNLVSAIDHIQLGASLAVVFLPTFRALDLTWANAKYPLRGTLDAETMSRVTLELHKIANAVRNSARNDDHNARRGSAIAIEEACRAVSADEPIHHALEAAFRGAEALGQDVSKAMSDAFEADIEAAQGSNDAGSAIAALPMWHTSVPDRLQSDWRKLKANLLAATEGWEVWTDWYEARLAGDGSIPPNKSLEVARVSIPEEVWKHGPVAVNAEIKRLIEAHRPKTVEVETLEAKAADLPDGKVTVGLPGIGMSSAAAGFVPPNPPPQMGWLNPSDDTAALTAAHIRRRAIAAQAGSSTAQPPFPLSQEPSASTTPSFTSSTVPSESAPSADFIPPQERTATQFGVDSLGRIDIIQVPPDADELQQFHYNEMRHKARELIGLGQMLGDMSSPVTRFLEALPEQMAAASVDRIWSRGNTLRRRHDAHVATPESLSEPHPARLDNLVAENLGDLIDSFNVFVSGDARARELDSIRRGPQDREAVRKIVDLAGPVAWAVGESTAIATAAAQETLTEQVAAASNAPADVNGDQAMELARKTTGNFVSELLRGAYAQIAKLKARTKGPVEIARKGVIEGFYREGGKAAFDGLAVSTGPVRSELSKFIIGNAEALKDFAVAQFHNDKMVALIDWIVQLARHPF